MNVIKADQHVDTGYTPHIFVISGPSGAGKDTIIERLLPLIDVDTVITMTTRARRANEIEGVHYRFASVEQFEEMRDRGELLECAWVHGNWYGVPADSVRESLAQSRDVLIKVDPQGASTIKRLMPEAIFIFLRPASLEELRERLIQRGSESEADLALRLRNAEIEMAEQTWFDFKVDNPNGQIDIAVHRLFDIIASVKHHSTISHHSHS
jgi:guanylate kinase